MSETDNKLQAEHIGPYLQHKLIGQYILGNVIDLSPGQKDEVRQVILTLDSIKFFTNNCKPILRPLTEILAFLETLEKEHEDWHYEWIDHCEDFEFKIHQANIMACPYDLMQVLLENHFDVFGLIPKGLAVDINTLNNE